jgi:YHS domain-containing protein
MKSRLLNILTVFLGIFIVAGPALAAESLKVVENEKVCMVTDMYFGKKQIPVAQGGKTYYGCCENCKETLSKDAKARTAVDPVSGRKVDKATAVIAARGDNSVVYFESKKTLEQYSKNASSGALHDGHTHQ